MGESDRTSSSAATWRSSTFQSDRRRGRARAITAGIKIGKREPTKKARRLVERGGLWKPDDSWSDSRTVEGGLV